jgi:hypothetical protein
MNLVVLSRRLMRERTRRNKAPAWRLTEMAVKKGKELARKHDADERLVVSSLYLAHAVFDPVWKGEVQSHHPELSAVFVKKYLDEWNVSRKEQEIILNSIQAHHSKVPAKSKIAEIVKNAECFKFVTLEGSLIFLHELGLRQVPIEEAAEMVIEKMKQKRSLLTLKDCKKEAAKNCGEILRIFNSLRTS